jgi:hypothetical protein
MIVQCTASSSSIDFTVQVMVVRGVRGVGHDQLADEAIIRHIPIHFDLLSKQYLTKRQWQP